MATRRAFLTSMLAAGLVPSPTWANVGNPTFLTAAKSLSGEFFLVGIRADLSEAFRVPLPTRGHAAVAHPVRPEAVAFARRPGTYAVVIDCEMGNEVARLDASPGRHFYGHGAFSSGGELLFTTENDYENAQGIIGVWDVHGGYRRVDEFPSGGIGPHEIVAMPNSETLVIANGGIETHPESGRAKLNLPMMRPNLAYCAFDGTLMQRVEPAPELSRNSIRHLAIAEDGAVYLAMQWQGDTQRAVPLVAYHRKDAELVALKAKETLWRDMRGYAGSIAVSADGGQLAVTSPRGNLAVVFDTTTHSTIEVITLEDVCGVAETQTGFVATTGNGLMINIGQGALPHTDLMFDNHLLRL